MTVVYLDELFLLNFVVDYLLLLSSARLAGEPLHRGRMALGAALGGIYAALLFLEGLGFLAHPLCRLAAAVGMLLCAYLVSVSAYGSLSPLNLLVYMLTWLAPVWFLSGWVHRF